MQYKLRWHPVIRSSARIDIKAQACDIAPVDLPAPVYPNTPGYCYTNRNHETDDWRIICSRDEKLCLRLRLCYHRGRNQNLLLDRRNRRVHARPARPVPLLYVNKAEMKTWRTYAAGLPSKRSAGIRSGIRAAARRAARISIIPNYACCTGERELLLALEAGNRRAIAFSAVRPADLSLHFEPGGAARRPFFRRK